MIPIKDDYKFQTISVNEKDNNKNSSFIIYVCDNVQKINFNENQNQIQNNNIINNDTNIKKQKTKIRMKIKIKIIKINNKS